MKKRKENNLSSLFMLLLYALMIVAVLSLTVAGGRLYATFTDNRTENENKRATISYVQSRIAAADAAGKVQIAEGPQGDALILIEGDTGYETRIYAYDGALMEEFTASSKEIQPESASQIAEVEEFSIEFTSDDLLCMKADGDMAYVSLKSEVTDAASQTAEGGVADEE